MWSILQEPVLIASGPCDIAENYLNIFIMLYLYTNLVALLAFIRYEESSYECYRASVLLESKCGIVGGKIWRDFPCSALTSNGKGAKEEIYGKRRRISWKDYDVWRFY